MIATSDRPKVVVLISGGSHLAKAAVDRYAAQLSEVALTCIEERPPFVRKLANFVSRRSRNRGILSAIDAVAGRIVQQFVGGRLARRLGVVGKADHIVESVNHDAIVEVIEGRKPDIVVLNLCSILSAAQIARINAEVINVHPGVTPRYRGGGVTWTLSEGRFDLIGATLHRVDAGVDTGSTVGVALVDVGPSAKSVEEVLWAVHLAGVDLAVEYIKGHRLPAPPDELQSLESRFYPYPGLSVIWRAASRLRARH